ncbi:MAG: HAMP domain-containing histidine kinase, partial [Bacteroidia bacterium]
KSVIEEDLNYYGINLDFEFDIIKTGYLQEASVGRGFYLSGSLEELLERSGYKLSIRFPGRRDFIVAQMGSIFVVSIILLVIVTLSSLLIYRFYRRERDLSGNIVDFVNGMTHAFKTPLTNISLANSMIAKSDITIKDKKIISYTGIIKAEHRKLKERVDALLKTTFTETDQPSGHELIDLSVVTRDIADSFSVQLNNSGGSITLKEHDTGIYLYGNPDLFYIALSNIIDNSLKYSRETAEIIIDTGKKAGRVFIGIDDNGSGVPQEYLADIFEKYFRVADDEKVNPEGFGLGLYQVKKIITLMGGSVSAKNSPAGGLSINIELPLVTEK